MVGPFFRDSFRTWPRRSLRQRRKAFPATAQADAGPDAFGRKDRRKRTAGRLTKPPPGGSCGLALQRMRKRQASRSAHPGPRAFGPEGTDRRDTGPSVQDLSGGSGTSVSAPPPATEGASALDVVGQDRASARELRNRRDPGFRSMALPGGTEGFGSRIPPDADPKASAGGTARAGKQERKFQIRRAANRQGFGPDGEPAGKPERASGLRRTPEGAGPEPPVRHSALEIAQRVCLASQARFAATGQWGPAAMPAPITRFGPARGGTSRRRQSSNCRPASRQIS